jgi:hypothetical protein
MKPDETLIIMDGNEQLATAINKYGGAVEYIGDGKMIGRDAKVTQDHPVIREVRRLAREFVGTNSGDLKKAILSGEVEVRELADEFAKIIAEKFGQMPDEPPHS